MRLDYPEVLNDFDAAPRLRVRRWGVFALCVWLLLLTGDWAVRLGVFRWQDQWLPPAAISHQQSPAPVRTPSSYMMPDQMGAGLTRMVPVPWIAEPYAEFHPGYLVQRDAYGYVNAPLAAGHGYDAVVLGDSFMLALGTQTIAQVLADLSGLNVYNHARQGAGPFTEMRKFIASDRFEPAPRFVVWNLAARELGAELFQRQPVDYWFKQRQPDSPAQEPARSRILWAYLSPAALHKAWPNTSLISYWGRHVWAQLKLLVFRTWPQDVLGAVDRQYGPMLFYRENLRVLPLLEPERNAPAIVAVATRLAQRFRERGSTLVVVLVPEKEQIHLSALPAADQKALASGPELLAAIQRGLQANGVPVVNLLPVFLDATAQGTRLYWRDDTHWNDAGIRLAAEELWRTMEPLGP
ncbi:MAG: hypothetical protein WBK37_11555 [Kiritimatiellia bacterium]